MRNTRKILAFAALILIVSVTSVWAGGGGENESATVADQPKEITIAVIADAVTVDPHYGNELVSNIMFMHYYDSLVRRDADLQFVPGLAESWEVKADDVTWVFKLRRGVKFHNGNDFTAQDVAYTVERVRGSNMNELASNIAKVNVVDDYTVELVTPAPFAALPGELTLLFIVDEEYTKQAGDESMGLKPMGTGPYKMEEWVKEDHMTMVANEDYWGGPAEIKRVNWRPITNNATRTAAILTGEVDIIQDLSVFDVDRVKGVEGVNVLTRPSLLNIVLAIDVRDNPPAVEAAGGKNPMQDVRVRRAMAHAIDVESIKTAVMNGYSEPSEQYVPSSHVGYVEGLDFHEVYPFDVEGAKALMREAGWEQGFTVTLDATNNRYINDAQITQAIASQLAKINIDVELNLMPKANFFGYIRVPTPNSSFIMSGWDVPSGDAGNMYSVMFYSRDKKPGYGVVNRGGYSNPEVDDLIDKADSTASLEERDRYLQEATRILVDDVPMIPVHYEMDIYATKDYVQLKPRVDKFLYAYEIDINK